LVDAFRKRSGHRATAKIYSIGYQYANLSIE